MCVGARVPPAFAVTADAFDAQLMALGEGARFKADCLCWPKRRRSTIMGAEADVIDGRAVRMQADA